MQFILFSSSSIWTKSLTSMLGTASNSKSYFPKLFSLVPLLPYSVVLVLLTLFSRSRHIAIVWPFCARGDIVKSFCLKFLCHPRLPLFFDHNTNLIMVVPATWSQVTGLLDDTTSCRPLYTFNNISTFIRRFFIEVGKGRYAI